jgi:hypothetical protein
MPKSQNLQSDSIEAIMSGIVRAIFLRILLPGFQNRLDLTSQFSCAFSFGCKSRTIQGMNK